MSRDNDYTMFQALAVDTLDDNVWPIGHVAQELGLHPNEVVKAALELGHKPRIWICGIPYFSIRQIEQFTKHFQPLPVNGQPAAPMGVNAQ